MQEAQAWSHISLQKTDELRKASTVIPLAYGLAPCTSGSCNEGHRAGTAGSEGASGRLGSFRPHHTTEDHAPGWGDKSIWPQRNLRIDRPCAICLSHILISVYLTLPISPRDQKKSKQGQETKVNTTADLITQQILFTPTILTTWENLASWLRMSGYQRVS